MTRGFLRPDGAEANGDARRPDRGFWVVRAGRDLDWRRLILDCCKNRDDKPSTWVNVAFEGRTYCKLEVREDTPSTQPGGRALFGVDPEPAARSLRLPSSTAERGPCFYFPDGRTVVVADEDCIRGVIRQPLDSRPNLARADGWRTVCRSLIAAAWVEDAPGYVFDEVSGIMMEILTAIIPLRSKQPRRSYCGLDAHEIFRTTTSTEFRNTKDASRGALEAIGSLAETKVAYAAIRWTSAGQKFDTTRGMIRSMFDLARNCQVRCNERTVEVISRCKMDLVDFNGYFGGEALPAEHDERANVEPGQRLAR